MIQFADSSYNTNSSYREHYQNALHLIHAEIAASLAEEIDKLQSMVYSYSTSLESMKDSLNSLNILVRGKPALEQ